MSNIPVSHELLVEKQNLFDEKFVEIRTIEKTICDLVKTREDLKKTLVQTLSNTGNTTTSKNFVSKLKKKISKLNTQIEEDQKMLNQKFYEHQDIHSEIENIKSDLNITSDDEDDADDDPTLFGFKIRGIEEFCNNPKTIDKLIRILDPAVLERILQQNN